MTNKIDISKLNEEQKEAYCNFMITMMTPTEDLILDNIKKIEDKIDNFNDELAHINKRMILLIESISSDHSDFSLTIKSILTNMSSYFISILNKRFDEQDKLIEKLLAAKSSVNTEEVIIEKAKIDDCPIVTGNKVFDRYLKTFREKQAKEKVVVCEKETTTDQKEGPTLFYNSDATPKEFTISSDEQKIINESKASSKLGIKDLYRPFIAEEKKKKVDLKGEYLKYYNFVASIKKGNVKISDVAKHFNVKYHVASHILVNLYNLQLLTKIKPNGFNGFVYSINSEIDTVNGNK